MLNLVHGLACVLIPVLSGTERGKRRTHELSTAVLAENSIREHMDDGVRQGWGLTRCRRPFGCVGKAARLCSRIDECGPDCSTRRKLSGRGASPPPQPPPYDRGIHDELSL